MTETTIRHELAADLASSLKGKDHHKSLLERIMRTYGSAVIVANDGNAEVEYDAEAYSPREAARDYVDGGSWGDNDSTFWATVYTFTRLTLGPVTHDLDDHSSYTISVDPPIPPCLEAEHDWQSPVGIVGGIAENPGVWGHGGGVLIVECCMSCGCKRTTDTWAQDRQTGRQGLTSVRYEPGAYQIQ